MNTIQLWHNKISAQHYIVSLEMMAYFVFREITFTLQWDTMNFLLGWHACRLHQQAVQNVPRHQSQRGLEQPVQGTAEGQGHKNRRLGKPFLQNMHRNDNLIGVNLKAQ